MAKDYFKGEYGQWKTMPNGQHVFIADGESLDQALARFTEPEWSEHYTASEYAKKFSDKITYADFQYHYVDNNHNRIMPSKYAKQIVHDVFQKRKYRNPEYDALIFGGLSHKVHELIINDRYTNWFKGNLWTRRVQISISTRPEMLESISHEIGHAIDYSPKANSIRVYLSSSFISPKYGKSMTDMIAEELPDIEMIKDEVDLMVDAMHNAENLDENAFISQAIGSVVDTVQGFRGDKECKQTFGYLTHSAGYFENPEDAGTELFAELTASLFCHKSATFYNFIKQHCPKTIEIYHEILEEVQNKWKNS